MAPVDRYRGAGSSISSGSSTSSRNDWETGASVPLARGGGSASPSAPPPSDVSRATATQAASLQQQFPASSQRAMQARAFDEGDSDDDNANPKTSGGGRCPSRYDWSKHMPTIKHLYIEEDKTLKEVMGIMEKEHNFIAT